MAAGIIDVRKVGAVGDGVANDGPVLSAAFAAAGPEGTLLPPGLYRVEGDLATRHPVRFEGRLLQPRDRRLILGDRLHLDDYLAAFGSGELALRKALVALFAVEGDAELDLGGHRLRLSEPLRIDATRACGRKVLRGGRIAFGSRGTGAMARPGRAAPGDDEIPFALSVAGLCAGAGLSVVGMALELAGRAGGLDVEGRGATVDLRDCVIAASGGPAVRVSGRSGGGLTATRCEIRGGSVGIEVSGVGAAIADCRFERVAPALRLDGRGNRVSGCRIAPGASGLRPGLVLRRRDAACQVADCDFDGAAIRWEEGPDPAPEGDVDFSGLSVTASRFTGRDLGRHERWIRIAPDRPGRSLGDLSVTGNLFSCEGGCVERVEAAAPGLASARMRRVCMSGNTHRGVARIAESPATLRVRQIAPEHDWIVDPAGCLPFGAAPVGVDSVLPVGVLSDDHGGEVRELPRAEPAGEGRIRLRFSRPTTGEVVLVLRPDRPD